MNKLIEIQSVTAAYDAKPVLRDVSLTLCENDFLGVVGPNGGGKTTLLKVILRLLKPSRGQVVFYAGGHPVPSLAIGYLPQVNRMDRRFPVSVGEVVASGLMSEKRPLRGFSAVQRQRIADTLEWAGLGGMAGRPIGDLSGGELQRALLGRAIVSHPKVLILDEPNTYVDRRFASRLYDLLAEVNRDAAVILVSHDVGAVLPLVKNVAYVDGTLRYHAGNRPTEAWLDGTHGSIPPHGV
ncbi:MAG: ATP-binding cassette domain-containing protein [Tannerella sp.]|jgi:zinc transport system ATP-binding protein|nr:ATP-binding cassette domain-containing protein [Tannerella sp.]